ncbi:MAG: CpsD/CapB family tyrosine-protein kinase [Bryobacteraceae bacterium]
MSRVHDALRRAEQSAQTAPPAPPATPTEPPKKNSLSETATAVLSTRLEEKNPVAEARRPPVEETSRAVETSTAVEESPVIEQSPVVEPSTVIEQRRTPASPVPDLLSRIREIPFRPSADAHLMNLNQPHEAPAEEFRTLRTRLNHLQSLQPIHTVVVTSPSPAEGKSFAAVNLALAESQLEGNRTLLIDCDFRRPIVHDLFQFERTPGMTDYLQGNVPLEDALRRVENTNLYVMPAGEPVINPLELLNLREVKMLLDELPNYFNWVILDSPPLLFAADANLLSTLCHGTMLVVRIGSTTIYSVTRAMQSLCENNVLGIVVNGARRGELYSKYTYYHSYYYTKPSEKTEEEDAPVEAEPRA